MKYFRSELGDVFAYEEDGSQDEFITPGLVLMTHEEVLRHLESRVDVSTVERTWRDSQVSSTEWLVTRHRDELDLQLATTLTTDQFAQLLTYRQSLRDWPQSADFPDVQYRPMAPPWIAEQTQ